ncbi:O-antigen polymerase [Cytobacillus firmus]|uniref:O-antigen polymerase n=1 Tax=Cytobacillus firmus TaxID=1399 RepID=UPI00368D63FE
MLKPSFYLHPITINTFLFIYFIFLPFLFVSNKSEYFLAFFIAILGFFSFIFGYKLKFKRVMFLENEFKDLTIKRFLLIVFILIDLSSIYSFVFGGISQGAYNLGYLEVAGSNSLYKQVFHVAISFVKFYIYSGYMKNNKRLFMTLFLVSLFASFSSRVRFDVVQIIIFFGVFGIYFKYIKIGLLRIAIILMLSPIFMLAMLIKRDYVGNTNISNLFVVIQNSMQEIFYDKTHFFEMIKISMESFATFEIYNKVIADNFISPTNGIIRIIFNFIPRSIWSEKPYPLQIVLASEYNKTAYNAGGGVFANIYGDAYANGGLLGIIVIMFSLGIVSKMLYNETLKQTESQALYVGFYCVFLIYFTHFYRGYLSDMTWQFLLFIMTFIFLNCLEKYKIIK